MSLLFIVLSFLAWLWALAAERRTNGGRATAFILLVLLAVLSKPIAVIVPALSSHYEFCSEPHTALSAGVGRRHDYPVRHCTLALTAIFLVAGRCLRSRLPQPACKGSGARRLADLLADRP